MTAERPSLTLDHVVRRAQRTAETMVDGELIVLLIDDGACFGLNSTATRVWQLIGDGPSPLRDVRDALVAEFDVEPTACERELLTLVEAIRGDGLLEAI